MANIEIFGTLVRNDQNTNRDKIVKGSQVEGGYFVCETLPANGTWAEGQLCYCTGTAEQQINKFYQYNGSSWVDAVFYTHPETHAASMITGLADVATSGSYDDLTNKPAIPAAYTHPTHTEKDKDLYKIQVDSLGHVTDTEKVTLATVATSGSYSDLTDTPAAYSHPTTHPASMITDLATVATSGSYTDLTNTPSIPDAYIHPTHTAKDKDLYKVKVDNLGHVTDAEKVTLATVAISGDYNDLTNKPDIPTIPNIPETDADITLSEQFTITKDFGYYTLGGASSKKIGTVGQTLHSFLQGAFCSETAGNKYDPSHSFTISGAAEGEIGATYSAPTATFKVTSVGRYDYGPATGITYSGKLNGEAFSDLNATEGTNSKQVTFGSGGTYSSDDVTHTCNLEYSHTAGPAAKTNLGNTSGDSANTSVALLQISAKSNKTDSKSITFKGYRKMFMGATNSTATIDGTFIRTLSGKKAETGNEEVTAVKDDLKIIWAIPTSLTMTKPEFYYWFQNDWQGLSNVSEAATITVAGAGSDIGEDYYVYTYTPKGGAFETEMKTKIVINE